MSFKGEVEAQCPKGCEPFHTEVWSYIRADQSPELRDVILFREMNMILCPHCEEPFIPPEPYVYFEPSAELLAFVLPEAFRDKEDYWRRKMREDFLAMKQGLGQEIPLDLEPDLFFGLEDLARLLEDEDYRGEEREVMEHFARELGLSLYRVSPRYAREHRVPGSLPYRGAGVTRKAVIEGLERLVKANDRLTSYAEYLSALKSSDEAGLPPAAAARQPDVH